MPSSGADQLWTQAAVRIRAARGWSLRPLARLGRPRADRATWLADGEPGTVVVKASANPFAPARAAWVAQALAALGGRGYPVPPLLWDGPLGARWWLRVYAHLAGEPLRTLDRAALDQLLALVELQADPGLGPGGWDVSWWTGVVLFEGWEHWWDTAQAAAPATCRRLRAFLEPATGHRLPASDVVHGDLNLSNVLVRDGMVTGVVDWDAVGVGSRATDLAGLLLDWYRLRLADQPALAPDGDQRLVGRIVELAGGQGLRCTVTYGAVARLWAERPARRARRPRGVAPGYRRDPRLPARRPPAPLVNNPPLRNARRGNHRPRSARVNDPATRMKPAEDHTAASMNLRPAEYEPVNGRPLSGLPSSCSSSRRVHGRPGRLPSRPWRVVECPGKDRGLSGGCCPRRLRVWVSLLAGRVAGQARRHDPGSFAEGGSTMDRLQLPFRRMPRRRRGARQLGAVRVGALAVASAAVGAGAVGALAVGALAVGRLAVGRAVVRRLKIEELGRRWSWAGRPT